jgi:5-methylcytosine-specific restriction endonuclease McrA
MIWLMHSIKSAESRLIYRRTKYFVAWRLRLAGDNTMPFPSDVKVQALANSGRRCCLCLGFRGVKVEVHHIVPESASHDNSLDNAITLCFDCHADTGHYNPKHPKGNKLTAAELRKYRDRLWKLVEEGKALPEMNLDSQFLELLRRVFDRPAFTTPFRQEGRMEDFDKAIDDTVLALNTGLLRTRDNQVLTDLGFGKSSLFNAEWNLQLNDVEGQLLRLRSEVAKALAEGKLKCCHAHCYYGDEECMRQLDQIRVDIVEHVNGVLRDAGIGTLQNVLRGRM